MQYKAVHASTADEFNIKLTALARDRWVVRDFKYVEYSVNVKSEGLTVMQSYVALLERTL